MADAEELKQEGNDHFRAKRWDEAIAVYRSALGHLPRRPQQANARTDGDLDDDDAGTSQLGIKSGSQGLVLEALQAQHSPASELELEAECARARATLNANVSACYAKLVSFQKICLTSII